MREGLLPLYQLGGRSTTLAAVAVAVAVAIAIGLALTLLLLGVSGFVDVPGHTPETLFTAPFRWEPANGRV
jgi:hypothetical protein